MPEGSPWLTTMGRLWVTSSGFDNRVPPEIAKVAFSQNRHLLHEQLLLQLIAAWQLKCNQFWRRRITTHNDFESRGREIRLYHLARRCLCHSIAQFRRKLLQVHLSEIVEHAALQLLRKSRQFG